MRAVRIVMLSRQIAQGTVNSVLGKSAIQPEVDLLPGQSVGQLPAVSVAGDGFPVIGTVQAIVWRSGQLRWQPVRPTRVAPLLVPDPLDPRAPPAPCIAYREALVGERDAMIDDADHNLVPARVERYLEQRCWRPPLPDRRRQSGNRDAETLHVFCEGGQVFQPYKAGEERREKIRRSCDQCDRAWQLNCTADDLCLEHDGNWRVWIWGALQIRKVCPDQMRIEPSELLLREALEKATADVEINGGPLHTKPRSFISSLAWLQTQLSVLPESLA